MWKKITVAAALLMLAISAQAQIGYKGQMTFEATAGINNLGGYAGSARLDRYITKGSIVGVGIMYDKTKYNADDTDSFEVEQWQGVLGYRYAVPINMFIISPSAGILLGGEKCDQLTNNGNYLPYKSQFIYGLMIECNIEVVIARHWTLALKPQMSYLLKTQFDDLRLGAMVGVRYYF